MKPGLLAEITVLPALIGYNGLIVNKKLEYLGTLKLLCLTTITLSFIYILINLDGIRAYYNLNDSEIMKQAKVQKEAYVEEYKADVDRGGLRGILKRKSLVYDDKDSTESNINTNYFNKGFMVSEDDTEAGTKAVGDNGIVNIPVIEYSGTGSKKLSYHHVETGINNLLHFVTTQDNKYEFDNKGYLRHNDEILFHISQLDKESGDNAVDIISKLKNNLDAVELVKVPETFGFGRLKHKLCHEKIILNEPFMMNLFSVYDPDDSSDYIGQLKQKSGGKITRSDGIYGVSPSSWTSAILKGATLGLVDLDKLQKDAQDLDGSFGWAKDAAIKAILTYASFTDAQQAELKKITSVMRGTASNTQSLLTLLVNSWYSSIDYTFLGCSYIDYIESKYESVGSFVRSLGAVLVCVIIAIVFLVIFVVLWIITMSKLASAPPGKYAP